MKKLFLSFLVICSFNAIFAQQLPKQRILEEILKMKEINELLSLDSLKDRGPIRIVDKTGKFKKVNFLFKPSWEMKGNPLTVATVMDYEVDYNTGYRRDLAILGFKKEHDNTYRIDVYLSNYLCVYSKKNKWHFEFKIRADGDNVEIISESHAEWD